MRNDRVEKGGHQTCTLQSRSNSLIEVLARVLLVDALDDHGAVKAGAGPSRLPGSEPGTTTE